MKTRKAIRSLLEKRTGLAPETIGAGTIDKALLDRMAAVDIEREEQYLQYLLTHTAEWNRLVERTVVPETWFFRNREAFRYMGEFARREWLPGSGDDMFRILSVPCSTGEEPYSAVMTLVDAGIPPERIAVDAVDISAESLHRAQEGLYGPSAFRGRNTAYRDRHFTAEGAMHRICPSLRQRVRFLQGNLMDHALLADAPPYTVVFCRNLLIYFNPPARRRAVRAIDRLLAPEGLLFVGHAEQETFRDAGFVWLPRPQAFAYRRKTAAPEPAPPPAPSPPLGEASPGKGTVASDNETGGNQTPPSPPVPPETTPAVITAVRRKTAENEMPSPDDLLEAAQELADQGSLDDAFKKCRICLQRYPTHARAHFLMGMLYLAVENDSEAEVYLERVLYLDPGHYAALEPLALLAERRGDTDRAGRIRGRASRIRERR